MPTQIGAMYREDDASGKRSKIYEFTVPLAALAGAAALLGRVDALETSVSALATSVAALQTADVSWDELTDKPTEFPPAAHTQDWSTITGTPATFPPGAHTQAWSTIIDTPTTLGGYGITDAYTKTEVDGFLTPITAAVDALELINTETGKPTGLPNTNDDSTLAFDNGTRTVTITPTGAETPYYIKGERFAFTTAQSVVIDNIEGGHFVYFDGETLTSHHEDVGPTFPELLRDYCYVAYIYWDATNARGLPGDERHGASMSWATHYNIHLAEGTRFIEGGALGDFTLDANGSLDAHAQFTATQGKILDEDRVDVVAAKALTDTIYVGYRLGADGDWRWEERSAAVINTGTGRAAWNEFTGGAWQLTELTNNDYVIAHIFLTNFGQFFAVIGQGEYSTEPAAEDAVATEVDALLLGGLPFQEFVYVGPIIYQSRDAFANTFKAAVVSNANGDGWLDFRFTDTRGGAGAAADHGQLSGLLDNDHPQYAVAGTGTELQYRAGASSFGAIAGSSWDGVTEILSLPKIGIDGSLPLSGQDLAASYAGFGSAEIGTAFLGDLQWGNGTPTYVVLDVDSNNLRLNYFDGLIDNYTFSVDATTGDVSCADIGCDLITSADIHTEDALVYGSDNSYWQATSTAGAVARFGAAGSLVDGGYAGTTAAYNFHFLTNNISRGYFTAAGALVVGSTDPDPTSSAVLRVGGAGLFSGTTESRGAGSATLIGAYDAQYNCRNTSGVTGITLLRGDETYGWSLVSNVAVVGDLGIYKQTAGAHTRVIGFGTTTPPAPAGGEVLIGGGEIKTGGALYVGTGAGSPVYIPWIYNNTTGSAANVFVNSSGILYRSTSSMRYKDHDAWLSDHSLLDLLRPVAYTEKASGRKLLGLYAEDCAHSDPRLAVFDEQGRPDAIEWNAVHAVHIAKTQHLEQRINELERRLAC